MQQIVRMSTYHHENCHPLKRTHSATLERLALVLDDDQNKRMRLDDVLKRKSLTIQIDNVGTVCFGKLRNPFQFQDPTNLNYEL